ncbi:prepilin peptidase, partial [Candidatus Woesearchaeota archaeon]|nr:prepilin peptidase [Candidatus Woesearchaeota archaeon]
PVLALLALLALLVASYTDLKTREVPDWLSYSLIAAGLGIRAIFAAVLQNPWLLLYGVLGFALFWVLGYGMYRLGQWGGGDAKLLMGLGALMGFQWPDAEVLSFLVLIILIGGLYGFGWSIALSIRHYRDVRAAMQKWMKEKQRIKRIALAVALLLVIGSLFAETLIRIPLLLMAVLLLGSYYTFIFAKSVEEAAMKKMVLLDKVTEGDWIIEDIVVKGQYITGPRELGITKEQLAALKKAKVKEVLVKYGIPFVPSFLLAFIGHMLLSEYGITIVNLLLR